MNDHANSNGKCTLLTCAEIAGYLGVCETTVWHWRNRHDLPVAKRPDGLLYTTKSLIDQWFMARIEAERAVKAEAKRKR